MEAFHVVSTVIHTHSGMPVETVSSMLGHKILRTTQIYAKVVEHKVEEGMDRLEQRLSDVNKFTSAAKKLKG